MEIEEKMKWKVKNKQIKGKKNETAKIILEMEYK
jgi:hypothetical protein